MALSDSDRPVYSESASDPEIATSSTPQSSERIVLSAPTAAPPALTEGPTIGALIRALKRRWLIGVVLGCMAAALAGALLWHVIPAPYTAQATIRVHGRPPAYVTGGDAHLDFGDLMRSQASLIQGDVLGKVLDDPEIRALSIYQEHAADLWNWAAKNVMVRYKTGQLDLPIQISGEKPPELSRFANRMAEEYITKMIEQREKRRDSLIISKGKLEEKLRELARQVPDHDVDPQNGRNKLEQAQKLHHEAQVARKQLETQIAGQKALKSALVDGSPYVAPKRMLDDAYRLDTLLKDYEDELKLLKQEYNNLKRLLPRGARDPKARNKLVDIKEVETSRSRRMRQIETETSAHARREKVAEIDSQIVRLERELEERGKQEQEALAQVQKAEREAGVKGRPPAKIAIIEEINSLKDNLRKVSGEIHEIDKEKETAKGGDRDAQGDVSAPLNWATMTRAKNPKNRDRKKQILITGMGGISVFGLMLLFVAYVEYRSRKITRTEDLVEGLGIPSVGTVPRLPSRARQVHVDSGVPRNMYWQGRLTEAIDAIRTLLLRVTGDGPRVVMVTSAVEGEGKTSLASQLAASLARSWRKTLLVDGDLRKPAAHKLFNLPVEPGLSEVLRGEMEIKDVVRPTALGRLWLMPAGQWDSHAIQALAQEGAYHLFDELKEEYELIIVDSSPVLPVADTLLLGQQADTVILSVLNASSRMPLVYAAQQRLTSLDIPVMGAVLIGGSSGVGGLDLQYPRPSGN